MKNIIQYEVAFVGKPAVDTGGQRENFFLKTEHLYCMLLPLLAKDILRKIITF